MATENDHMRELIVLEPEIESTSPRQLYNTDSGKLTAEAEVQSGGVDKTQMR